MKKTKKGEGMIQKLNSDLSSEIGDEGDDTKCLGSSIACNGTSTDEKMELTIQDDDPLVPPYTPTLIMVGDLESNLTDETGQSSFIEPHQNIIDELNAKHAVVNFGGKCRIITQAICPDFGNPIILYSSLPDLKGLYQNQKITSKKGKEITTAEYWFNHKGRRQYDGVVFSPGKSVPGYLNLWQGFTVQPINGDCGLYLDLIEEVIAGGDKEISRYILSWMANIVQNLSYRPGVSIVLKGDQGTGKGTLCKHFGELFGQHYVHLTSNKHLVGDFNAHLESALFVFADEAFLAGQKKSEGVLKALITEGKHLVEKKGIDGRNAKNNMHLIIASNNDQVVNSEIGDRRFFVVQVTDKRKRDRKFFGALESQMDNGGKEALLYYLLNYDFDGYDLGVFPNTNAVYEEKINSLNPVQKFWLSRLEDGVLLSSNHTWGTGKVSVNDFKGEFAEFCSDAGLKRFQQESEMGKELRKLLPGNEDPKKRISGGGKRTYFYQFSPLDECRKHFSEIIRYDIPWSS